MRWRVSGMPSNVPLAAGERVSTIWGIQPYIERGLVDVIQPDTGRAGGITQMRKMAAMAEGHYITMAPHSGSLARLRNMRRCMSWPRSPTL